MSPLFRRPGSQPAADASSPETSQGGPVYDARIDPAIAADDIVAAERLAQQRNLHLYGEKTAPAEAFSHFSESVPSPLAADLAGLAYQRDQLEMIVSRKNLAPFPGVELGHVPAFGRSPDTTPIVQPVDHFRYGAHQFESKQTSRRRFGA